MYRNRVAHRPAWTLRGSHTSFDAYPSANRPSTTGRAHGVAREAARNSLAQNNASRNQMAPIARTPSGPSVSEPDP